MLRRALHLSDDPLNPDDGDVIVPGTRPPGGGVPTTNPAPRGPTHGTPPKVRPPPAPPRPQLPPRSSPPRALPRVQPTPPPPGDTQAGLPPVIPLPSASLPEPVYAEPTNILEDAIAATEENAGTLERAIEATLDDAAADLGSLIDGAIAASERAAATALESEVEIPTSVLADLSAYVMSGLGGLAALLYSEPLGNPAEDQLDFGGLPGYGPSQTDGGSVPPTSPGPDDSGLSEYQPTDIPRDRLPLVTVDAPAPRASPSAPAVLQFPSPVDWPGPAADTGPQPRPRNAPSPRPGIRPVGSPTALADLSPQPAPQPAPRPAPAPRRTAPKPSDTLEPSNPPFPGLGTQTQPQGDCNCSKPSKTKKKKKPREECWKGTYVEKRLGLNKTRREKVKCQ